MVIKNMPDACRVLKIFADATRGIIGCIESTANNDRMFKAHTSETIGRLQDVLENIEVD